MEYSPKKMQEFLEKNNFYFKKNFGQNFIIDENVIDSIIRKASIDERTMVIEIGPGAGSLTYKLCDSCKNVLCYEIDFRLKDILENVLKNKSNVDIKWVDFLEADVISDLKQYSYDKLYVVANLPYYITTPIIMKFIEEHVKVDKMVLMVQKEVGERLKASVGTRDYGSLTVFLNYYFEIKKLMDISKNVFLPKPNVDSIIVELSRRDNCCEVDDENLLFKIIKDSFVQKRKNIRNNLKKYNLDVIERVLRKHGFDLSVRAEQLGLDVFIDIANEMSREGMYD